MSIDPESRNKDQAQVLKESYDTELNRLKVEAIVTDGIDAIVINEDGSLNVNVGSMDLPDGAATEAKQDDTINKLDEIYTELQNKADATENQSVTSFGVIDTNNSTSTPLAGSASFTGTASDMLEYGSLSIKVFSDQDSTLDGLKLQFSANGTDWDDTVDFNILANVGRSFIVPVLARYFRVKFDNGSSPQTIFRLQVIKRSFAPGTIQTPLDSRVLDQDLAVLSRSVLTAKQPNNLYTNINATSGGNLKVSVEEFDDGAFTDRELILKADDLVETFNWTDFGTADERVDSIEYSSASVGATATLTFAYTLVSGSYRLDTKTWTVT